MTIVSLWDTPHKIEPKASQTVLSQNNVLEEQNKSRSNDYIIIASNTKTGKIYLGGYRDSNAWYFSKIPFKTDYESAIKLVNQASKEFNKRPKIYYKSVSTCDFKIEKINT